MNPAEHVGCRVKLLVDGCEQPKGATGTIIKNTNRYRLVTFPYLVRWDTAHVCGGHTIWENPTHDWAPEWNDVEVYERVYTVNKLGNFPHKKEERHGKKR